MTPPRSSLPGAVEDGIGVTRRITRNRYGQLRTFTDCSGYMTRYEYDRYGQQIAVHREEGLSICVFRSIRSRIGIEVRSAIRIHSINRELNFFYRFLTRFFAAFHYRGIFPQ
ncbi:RHS repeat protein [Escherichia coli]|nr:RHS repeat protein [Escherichia coli]